MSKERFIADKVRVRKSKFHGAVVIEVRESRTAEPSYAALHPDEAIRVIVAIAAVLSESNRSDG